MGKAHNPRHGSMQFWPRKRSRRMIARVRSFINVKENKPVAFAGFKAGMSHISYIDQYNNSLSKGEEISSAVTIIECPPLKVYGVRFYKSFAEDGIKVVYESLTKESTKELSRAVHVTKKTASLETIPEYDYIRLIVYTQPKLTAFGRKKPDLFEVAISGSKEDQLKYAKENIGKEIKVSDVFKEGDFVDVHGVTKGKGYQGTVKRYGVAIQRPKKEKIKRGVAARSGGWCAQGHMMYRVGTPGQMGFHQRTELNKQIVKISDNPKEINPKGGIIRYGVINSTYMLLKGSVIGPKKRLLAFTFASRPKKNVSQINVKKISIESHQGK
jgi:large subunit ribosomal protein L3